MDININFWEWKESIADMDIIEIGMAEMCKVNMDMLDMDMDMVDIIGSSYMSTWHFLSNFCFCPTNKP